MREVIAEQLEVIGDEDLEMVTITGIDIDPDLSRAVVWFSALTGDVGVEGAVVALARHRAKLQAAVGRQVRMKRTPLLQFKPDPAITQGIRIEEVLRTMPRSERELDDDGYPIDPDGGAAPAAPPTPAPAAD